MAGVAMENRGWCLGDGVGVGSLVDWVRDVVPVELSVGRVLMDSYNGFFKKDEKKNKEKKEKHE